MPTLYDVDETTEEARRRKKELDKVTPIPPVTAPELPDFEKTPGWGITPIKGSDLYGMANDITAANIKRSNELVNETRQAIRGLTAGEILQNEPLAMYVYATAVSRGINPNSDWLVKIAGPGTYNSSIPYPNELKAVEWATDKNGVNYMRYSDRLATMPFDVTAKIIDQIQDIEFGNESGKEFLKESGIHEWRFF